MERIDLARREEFQPELTVVTPMFNEEDGILTFLGGLRSCLDSLNLNYEVVVVDDGSSDHSIQKVQSMAWDQCKILALSRNCGHQIALEAGIAGARGSWVLTMDSDGQHPAELIEEMLQTAISEDLDVVYARQRLRRTDTAAKKFMAHLYYKVVRLITRVPVADGQADFRIMSRQVVDDILEVPGDKVLRLLIPSAGYASSTLEYDVQDRIAGKGRYGLSRQMRMAVDSILQFSSVPLRFVAVVGLGLSILAAFWLVTVVVAYFQTRTVAGWSSVMAAVLTIGGLTLVSLSVLGEYLARIYIMMRRHPRYIVREVLDSGTAG